MSDSDEDYDCERHEINLDDLPTDYDHCPRCRQEDDRHRQMVERMARRAPRSVDDPAPYGSYRAW